VASRAKEAATSDPKPIIIGNDVDVGDSVIPKQPGHAIQQALIIDYDQLFGATQILTPLLPAASAKDQGFDRSGIAQ
jgi:hypothetical protein